MQNYCGNRVFRQIHPVCEEKLQLGYEEERATETLTHPSGAPPYPLVPNICVEGGRIEFIKAPVDSSTTEFSKAPLGCSTVQPPSPPHEKTDIAKVRQNSLVGVNSARMS